MGMRQSDADIVVFMTQDAVPADRFLIEHLMAPFEREDVGAAYARQLPRKDCHIIERYTRSFNYPEKSRLKGKADIPVLGIKTFFCSDVCAAYSKKAYEETGGFEKKTIFNEDMILAGHMVEKGYMIAYAADAQVIHSHNYTGLQQFHRNFDLAVSQAEHPEVFAGIASESEGIRLVKSTARYLLREKKGWLIPKTGMAQRLQIFGIPSWTQLPEIAALACEKMYDEPELLGKIIAVWEKSCIV